MKINRIYLATLILGMLVLSACSTAAAPTAAPVHWTYEGEEGPAHWGDLSPDYATCGTGKTQSPIDISGAAAQDLANIVFHYQPSEVNILNNGHTAQVNYDKGSYLELDGVKFNVAQFHYHSPSEHTIDGKSYPAELHIVHKTDDGKTLAVIGLLIQEGAENAALAPFINNLPKEKSDAKDAGVQINVADLLPAVQTTYRYSGSLTTPPCSEGVNWLVMTTPIEASADQIAALSTLFGANNRPVQALNDRSLVEDNTP